MSRVLNNKGLSLLLIAAISLCFCVLVNGTKAYAAEKQIIYFDNSNTQFEEVYIIAENSLGNWTNYQFTVSDDSEYLSVQVPASGRKSDIIVKGGQNTFLGSSRDGEGTITFMMPHKAYDLYDTNKMVLYLDQFGSLQCDVLDTYQPETFTSQYNDDVSPFGNENTFNETPSNLYKLMIDGKDVLDENANKEGVGWRYDGQFLYLGECAPFNSTIEAEGNLSIKAVGSDNTLKSVTVSDNLELTCECGIVHLTGNIKSKDAVFNVSSYGVIYYEAIVDSDNVVFNGHPLGRHIVYGNSSYSKGRIQCKQFTANSSMIDVIFLGGSQVGIYCMDSCKNNNSTIGSRADGGGSNNEVYCAATDDITSAFFDNSSRHSTYLLHFPTDSINVQTRTDGKNGISLKRSKTTGQILSVEMDYCNHCFSDWRIIQNASCVDTGLKERECVVCHEVETEVIEAIGHTWNTDYTVDKAATCTEEGSESIHCSVCDAVQEGTSRTIEKKSHAYGDWTTTKEPTCTEDGSKEKICADCGDKVTEAIKSPGHQWNNPTYTWSSDYASVTATRVCKHDSEHKETETAKTTSEVTKAATYTAMGQTTYTAVFTNPVFTQQMKVATDIAKLPKKANTLTVKAKKPTVKYSKLKKKTQKITVKKAFTVKNPQGKVTYKVKKYDKKAKKRITVSKTGKVTVKKGLKKGTYKITVNVIAAGTAQYKAMTKTVKLSIKVK